jgi:signal peptidase II
VEVLREWLARARNPLAVQVGLLVAFGFIVLDQATKEVAETLLRPGEFVPLLSDSVGWQLVYNPGGAFGLPAPSWVFFVVTALVVLIVARTLTSTPSLLQATAYGLLLSGALGNLLDRILRPGDPDGFFLTDGFVVDFVAWGSFPRFNVADSAITVGFVLLVVALWIEERDASRATHTDADGDPETDGEAAGNGSDAPGEEGTGDPDEVAGAAPAGSDPTTSSDTVGASTQEPRGRT